MTVRTRKHYRTPLSRRVSPGIDLACCADDRLKSLLVMSTQMYASQAAQRTPTYRFAPDHDVVARLDDAPHAWKSLP